MPNYTEISSQASSGANELRSSLTVGEHCKTCRDHRPIAANSNAHYHAQPVPNTGTAVLSRAKAGSWKKKKIQSFGRLSLEMAAFSKMNFPSLYFWLSSNASS
mmetsp:Transcript_1463/g.1927  ORF Transcript_1463/g.1927 Transcript_1463/m.1927 type:complete len:103 (-) Transcript_1463:329-637(-)